MDDIDYGYGTFLCVIFGHKMVVKYRRYEGDSSFTGYTPLDFCIRCGQPKPVAHPETVQGDK